MSQDSPLQILAVTTERDTDSLIGRLASRDTIRVSMAQTAESAATQFRAATVDCVVCDTDLPDFDGIAFVEVVRARDPFRPVVVRAADGNTRAIDRASTARVTDIVTPGDEHEAVASLIESVARRYRTRSGPSPDLRTVLNGAPDPIFVLQGGTIAYANGAAGSQVGADGGERTAAELFAGVDLGCGDLETWAERITTGEYTFDFGTASITTRDPQEQVVDYVATEISWRGDTAVALVLTGGDVPHEATPATSTRQRKTGNGVLDDMAYRQLFEDAINGIAIQRIVIDENGRAVDYVFENVNAAFERITGLTAEEIQGKRGSTIFDLPEDPTDDPFISRYGDVTLEGERIEFEAYSEPLDQYHRVTAYPLGGNRIAAVFIDITDRVEATAELATYEEIVQRVGDPIMLQDRDGAFQVVNDALVEYAGIPRSELLGADEFAFMDEQTAERIQEMKARVLEREEPIDYTITPSLQGCGERSFATTRYPHYDETGTVVGTSAISRDITRRKSRERQLQVLSRVLRHNLRNDLNVITGNAEVLREQTRGAQRAAADRVLATGQEVIDLINTERHIVELLTGNVTQTVLPVTPLLSSAVETVQASFPAGEIEIHCPVSARIEAVPLLEDAVAELIENGIEHNESAPAHVSVEVSRDGDTLRIHIRDNGPGIPTEEQAVLTDQVEPSPLLHGTGLGLWLARYTITHVGGSLKFVDTDHGTHIVVSLPVVTD